MMGNTKAGGMLKSGLARQEFDKQFTTIRGVKAIAKHQATVTPDEVAMTKKKMDRFAHKLKAQRFLNGIGK